MSYYKEVDARSRAILETEDLQVLTGILTETEDGAVTEVTPSARELLAETDPEMKIGQMLKTCMTDGPELKRATLEAHGRMIST